MDEQNQNPRLVKLWQDKNKIWEKLKQSILEDKVIAASVFLFLLFLIFDMVIFALSKINQLPPPSTGNPPNIPIIVAPSPSSASLFNTSPSPAASSSASPSATPSSPPTPSPSSTPSPLPTTTAVPTPTS